MSATQQLKACAITDLSPLVQGKSPLKTSVYAPSTRTCQICTPSLYHTITLRINDHLRLYKSLQTLSGSKQTYASLVHTLYLPEDPYSFDATNRIVRLCSNLQELIFHLKRPNPMLLIAYFPQTSITLLICIRCLPCALPSKNQITYSTY